MLQIRKSDPPACIADLQQTPGSDWGSVKGDQKREMREHLLREQGGLCAYCMRRVTNDEKKCTVEHWRPRSDEQTDPFHWPDLLAVCDGGGSGAKRDTAHCDRVRGDAPLTLHPAHRRRIHHQRRAIAGRPARKPFSQCARGFGLNLKPGLKNRPWCHPQQFAGAAGDTNHAPGLLRPAIIDPQAQCAAIFQIGQGYDGRQLQAAMGGEHGRSLPYLAIAGAAGGRSLHHHP